MKRREFLATAAAPLVARADNKKLTEDKLRQALGDLAEMKDAVPIYDVTTPGPNLKPAMAALEDLSALSGFGFSVTVVDDHGVLAHFNKK